jgi:translation initiation factor 2D
MGKADVKKLRSSLLAEFPSLSKKALDVILGKDELTVHKCPNGTTLYVPGDGPPTLFEDGFGNVFPTLTTLWRLPDMMPELVTHPPVSKFLSRERSAGADMMLPGVIVPEGGLGDVHIGQKRFVRVEGNAMPIAVGRMVVGATEVEASGMKGKAMGVKHVYHDSLCAYSGRKVPNDGFLETVVVSSEGVPLTAVETAAPATEESDHADNAEVRGAARGAVPLICFRRSARALAGSAHSFLPLFTPPLFTPPLFTPPLFTPPLFTPPIFTPPFTGRAADRCRRYDP